MINRLDSRNKEILYELDINSRSSLKEISKKIRISPQAVENRIDKMVKERVINSFQTIIAYHRLSLTTYIVHLGLQDTSSEKEEQIIKKLKTIPEIIAIWKCEGIYDMLLAIQTKNIFQLNKMITKINNLFGKFIRNYDISTNIGSEHYPRDYLSERKKQSQKPKITGGEETFVKLDKTDYLILEALIKNPRISFVDLASSLDLSIDVVRYRIKKIKEKNIIQGFSLVLNHQKFGYLNFRVLMKLKNITEDTKKDLFAFASLNPNIRMATKSFGAFELALDIEVETHEQLRKILSNFRNKFNNHIHSHHILNIYKIDKYNTFLSKKSLI